MKKYVILSLSVLCFFLLYQLGLIVQERKSEREARQAVHTIEEYVARVRECQRAYPKAGAGHIHRCATE